MSRQEGRGCWAAGALEGASGAAHGSQQCQRAAWRGGQSPRAQLHGCHATRARLRPPGGPGDGAAHPASSLGDGAAQPGSRTASSAAPACGLGFAGLAAAAAAGWEPCRMGQPLAAAWPAGAAASSWNHRRRSPGRGPPLRRRPAAQREADAGLLQPAPFAALWQSWVHGAQALDHEMHAPFCCAGVAQAAEEAGGLCAGLRPAQGLAGPQ